MGLARLRHNLDVEHAPAPENVYRTVSVATRDMLTRLTFELRPRDLRGHRLPVNVERARGDLTAVWMRHAWISIEVLVRPTAPSRCREIARDMSDCLRRAQGSLAMTRDHRCLQLVAERELRRAFDELNESQDNVDRLIVEARYDA